MSTAKLKWRVKANVKGYDEGSYFIEDSQGRMFGFNTHNPTSFTRSCTTNVIGQTPAPSKQHMTPIAI